jgi:hypothetical protein
LRRDAVEGNSATLRIATGACMHLGLCTQRNHVIALDGRNSSNATVAS